MEGLYKKKEKIKILWDLTFHTVEIKNNIIKEEEKYKKKYMYSVQLFYIFLYTNAAGLEYYFQKGALLGRNAALNLSNKYSPFLPAI